MGAKAGDDMLQITMRKNAATLIRMSEEMPDGLGWWAEQYFRFEVTTSPASQKVQQRDLNLFLRYIITEERTDQREAWTPRLSRDFQLHLRQTLNAQGQRVWSDKTIIRVMAHLKTFAKWVQKLRPFPLGNPMAKITLPRVGTGLEVERALTPAERRKMLDGADLLVTIGGRSRDRKRYRKGERPKRKGYRPYRNRAIVYALIETGMRRAAITTLNLDGMDVRRKTLTVEEKGGSTHTYQISHEGLQAMRDYVAHERKPDAEYWQSPALFLPASTARHSHGRLAALAVNEIWNTVCRVAGVHGRTPHSARHAMGKYLIEKTGNIAAVQKQLGHKQAAYAMQYARITAEELGRVLDGR
jgi:site-specific recombinase XerD